jgi:rod shape-determining protein MreC
MLLGLALLSIALATLDAYTDYLRSTRALVLQIVTPVYYIAEALYLIGNSLNESLSSRKNLLAQLERQREQLLALSHTAQRYRTLKADNDRMRVLLGSKEKLPGSVLIAEIVSARSTPSSHQVIIDKGAADGLQVGQAVLDAEGLFGQLVEVGNTTSRVLLLIDKDHAVPVQVTRNGARSIAGGTGSRDSLVLENVPVSIDIMVGDLLETSGLGGRFPVGYPVAEVTSVVLDATSVFAEVKVRPLARTNQSRFLLVVFAADQKRSFRLDEEV